MSATTSALVFAKDRLMDLIIKSIKGEEIQREEYLMIHCYLDLAEEVRAVG